MPSINVKPSVGEKNTFVFPSTLTTQPTQPFLKLMFYKFDSTVKSGSETKVSGLITDTFYLEAPKDQLNEQYNHTWNEEGDYRYISENFIKTLQENFQNRVKNFITRGMFDDIAQQFINANYYQEGHKLNDYKAMCYQGMNFRMFNFNFDFIPHSKEESESLFKMINRLKQITMPKYNAQYIEFPEVCKIEMNTANGIQLYKSGFCGVTNMSFDYSSGSDGLRTHVDGYPVSVKMNLEIQEIFKATENDVFYG